MYTVYGYDFLLFEFKWSFDSFVEAVKMYRKQEKSLAVVFMKRDTNNSCLFVK